MAVETRSLKAFSSQPAEEALDTRAIIWHVFCHVRAAIWFSLSWLHPVTLFEVIWGFHLGVYRAIPAITSVLYPRRRRLLSWIRSQVPAKEVPDLAAVWRNGALLCALVEASVAPDPQLGLRFDKYRCSAVPSMKLGQKLAAEYLRVSPEFTESELDSEMTPAIMARLVEYLSALQNAAILLKEGCHLTTDEETPEVTARGMGLVMAVQGRRATFSIYPIQRRAIFNSYFDSILVQIRGPNEDTGSVLVTQYNSQAHHTPGGLRRIIPIHVTVSIECARITYTPLSSGLHELSLLFRGNHIANSPHKVSVESRGIHSEFNVISRPFITKSHILSRTVDFITEKRTLTEDGRLVEMNEQPTSFLSRQLSLRKRTKHVMAKRKIIGRRKLGIRGSEDSVNDKSVSPVESTSDVKIIVHEIEDRRRKSLTPPHKSDFKESCKKILWMCDLLLKNNSKDNSLRILNTAEQILTHGKDSSIKTVAPSPMSEKALCRLRGHLHATNGGLNDVTDIENSKVKKSVILKGLTEESTKNNDELKVLPPENFTVESLPISPTKSQFSSLTNLYKARRCSEPIEISREKCGFEELDEIVYSDYCIVNISPILERKSELSTPIHDTSATSASSVASYKTLDGKQLVQNESNVHKLQDAFKGEDVNQTDKLSDENNLCMQNREHESIDGNLSNEQLRPINLESNIAKNTPAVVQKNKIIKHPTLEESKIMADIAIENYESIMKSKNLEEALKHFEEPQIITDISNPIKIEDWMGPAEKEIWTNELKWYESETCKSIDDVFIENAKLEILPGTENCIDIQTCFEDIHTQVSHTFLEENKKTIAKDIALRRNSFKNSKSDSLAMHTSKIENSSTFTNTDNIIFSADMKNAIFDDNDALKKIDDCQRLLNYKTPGNEIDDEALAIIKNFTTSVCESISPLHTKEENKHILVERGEDALLLCDEMQETLTLNALNAELDLDCQSQYIEERNRTEASGSLPSMSIPNTCTDFMPNANSNLDNTNFEIKQQNTKNDGNVIEKCFDNLIYEPDCEEKFNEIIANEQIDSLTSEHTEESLKEFDLIYQASIDEIDTKVAKELFPETINPETDLLIFQKLKDGMNKLAEATKRLSKSLPHETFIRETAFVDAKSNREPRSLSIFSEVQIKKSKFSRNLTKGVSLEFLSLDNNKINKHCSIKSTLTCEVDKKEFCNDVDFGSNLGNKFKNDTAFCTVEKHEEEINHLPDFLTKNKLSTDGTDSANIIDIAHTSGNIDNQNNDTAQSIELVDQENKNSFSSFEENRPMSPAIGNQEIEETTSQKTDDDMDTIVNATRRLSLSLIRLSNTQDSLHVPEYLQLLSHSPDIASIGTPDRSQQLSPCPQSPDIPDTESEIGFINQEIPLHQDTSEIHTDLTADETEIPQEFSKDDFVTESMPDIASSLRHNQNSKDIKCNVAVFETSSDFVPQLVNKNLMEISLQSKNKNEHILESSYKTASSEKLPYSLNSSAVESIAEEEDDILMTEIKSDNNFKVNMNNSVFDISYEKDLALKYKEPSEMAITESKPVDLCFGTNISTDSSYIEKTNGTSQILAGKSALETVKDAGCESHTFIKSSEQTSENITFSDMENNILPNFSRNAIETSKYNKIEQIIDYKKESNNIDIKPINIDLNLSVLDNIATLKENYPLSNASNLADNTLQNLNNNIHLHNLEICNINEDLVRTANFNCNISQPLDVHNSAKNIDLHPLPIEKDNSQDSLTNLIDEIERDKNLYYSSMQNDTTLNKTKTKHFSSERQDSLVNRRKSFWDEKILSEDDGAPIMVEIKPRPIPKKSPIKSTGIVAKKLKCFEQPAADGCFHARRAWASPNATPEAETPPPIAPDLIASQHNTKCINAPEIVPRKIPKRSSISSKLSIFEQNKLTEKASKVSDLDTPDIIKNEKEGDIFSIESKRLNNNVQSLPLIRSNPLERKSLAIFQKDSNNIGKDIPSKVQKKLTYESNRFAKRIEEIPNEIEKESEEIRKSKAKKCDVDLPLEDNINFNDKGILSPDAKLLDKSFGNIDFNFKDETQSKTNCASIDAKNPLIQHTSQSADSKFYLIKKKDAVLEKTSSLGSKPSPRLSMDRTINDPTLRQRKGSVALTKQLLDQNAKLLQNGPENQSLYHTVKYTTGETKIAIVPPREKSIESKVRPRRMSLLKMFSIEVTPSLEIETNFVNPLCDLNADETAPPPPLAPAPLKKSGDTQERFNQAKNFFKTLETKDIEDSPIFNKPTRGSSLGRIGGLRTRDKNITEKNNVKKFCSERHPKSVERFHVRDLFKDIEDKTVGSHGIPNPLAVVASLNSAVAEQRPGSVSPYDLAKDEEDTELPHAVVLEEDETIEPESTGLQRRGSLERHLSFKRLSERSTAEMF